MQQYYTLEEAASRLQMAPDELREMAKTKKIRAFQDRGTWRFRTQDVEELARTRGVGSDPELQVKEAPSKRSKVKPADEDAVAVDFNLDDKSSSSKSGPKSGRSPRPKTGDSDVRLVMDSNVDFQIEDAPTPAQSPRPKAKKSKLRPNPSDSGVRLDKQPSDSDVKVVPAANDSDVRPRPGKSPSDSDIRLEDSGPRRKKGEASAVTEELIDLDEEVTASKQVPKPGKKPRVTQAKDSVLPTNSPFELSESDVNLDKPSGKVRKPAKPDKKDKDSSSDFELVPFDSSKSPGDLGSGEIPLLPGDDDEVALGELGHKAGNSGINLQDPADSGISLESGGSDEIEFELTLDSGTTPKPAQPKAPVVDDEDSSSEFELSVDDSSSEFELSLDDDAPSDDQSSSEFELSLDDSGDAVGMGDESGSDSEFELTLDDEGGLAVDDESKDELFEPTNFDVPALDDDSGSEAVAIDEADTDLDSDFDLALDEDSDSGSDSQVVALDGDEEADTDGPTVARPKPLKGKAKPPAKGKGKPKSAPAAVIEEDEELDFDLDEDPKAKKGGKKKKVVADDDDDDDEDEEESSEAVAAAPADWGVLPALVLIPTVIVLFLVAFMGFELMQGMFGYQRPAKGSKMVVDAIARPVADMMDAKLPEDKDQK